MSKSKAVPKVFAAPPLRKVALPHESFDFHPDDLFFKAKSSPMIKPEEPENPPFPAALQEQQSEDIIPERWMQCVVRREKINYAVGRIIQVAKVSNNPGFLIRNKD